MPIERLCAVLFDLDGTLFDADYDWPWIKAQLGMAHPDGSILDHLRTLEKSERAKHERFLARIEDEATEQGQLREGVPELLTYLANCGVKRVLVTNNRRHNAELVIRRYDLAFDAVVTRDDGVYKPTGAPLIEAAERVGCPVDHVIYVGDNELDVQAARDAGVAHLIIVGDNLDRFRGRCDALASDIDGIRMAIEQLSGARPSEPTTHDS